eukprot:jgi/Botrbrau1/17675/Bobra.0166s0100.1
MSKVCECRWAFDGIGSLPMAKIVEYRVVKQEDVDFEMRKRENRQLQSNSPPPPMLKQQTPSHSLEGWTSWAERDAHLLLEGKQQQQQQQCRPHESHGGPL